MLYHNANSMIKKSILNKYPFDENLYLHRSLKPLKDVDFDAKNKKGEKFQEDMDEECEGMCGV